MISVRMRTAAAVALVGLVGSLSMTTPGAVAADSEAAEEAGPWGPVGVWTGTVQHAEGSGPVTLSFTLGGKVCLTSGGGEGGGGEGEGTWHSTGGNTFSYQVVERLFAEDGETVGWVHVDQQAQQQAHSVQSSGMSEVFGADGTPWGTVEATVSVTRTGWLPNCS
ncbi:hypothetical protein PJ985_18520 [Streptomyces sp. ACA25]|uniref:hypothetical protein n=1 Tax=Streptomyces sp. ACA25 TaxID=3022596 RepID=UPI0023073944|nr:hypothetical protein [Streptomyces sp. ACA25]MDB1089557.1 hypothetical protein [Streptomyces sp. ACA25]